MLPKKKISIVLEKLSNMYPDAKPELEFSSDYELLIAVILSAQCTDKRVNLVTRELFKNYNTAEKMLKLTESELGEKIFSVGLYKSKAKHIIEASFDIVTKHNGSLPRTIEGLTTLSGVGRKTANVVASVAFGVDAIAVDTHVFRVSKRIGLAESANVLGVERELMKNIPQNLWAKSHHYLIFHGRRVCSSQNPNCGICNLNSECEYYNKKR